MFKKISLILFAALLISGCSSTPKVVLGADVDEEENVVRPQWVIETEERQAKKAEEKKKEIEEYEKALAAQRKERPAPEKVNKEVCKINGHDCWQVLKIVTTGAKTSDQAAALKKLGLTITDSKVSRNGSKLISLSDGTSILISGNLGYDFSYMTVKLKDGRKVTYDADGYQIKLPFPEYNW